MNRAFKLLRVFLLFIMLPSISVAAGVSPTPHGYESGFATFQEPLVYEGFYFGAGGGYADTHWDNIEPVFKAVVPDFSVSSEDGFAWNVFLGYAFTPNFAGEAEFVYFPKVTMRATSLGGTKEDVRTYSGNVAAKIMVPMPMIHPDLGFFAKVGASYIETKDKVHIVIRTVPVAKTKRSDRVSVMFGAGVYCMITPQFSAALSWSRYGGRTKINEDYISEPDYFALNFSYLIGFL